MFVWHVAYGNGRHITINSGLPLYMWRYVLVEAQVFFGSPTVNGPWLPLPFNFSHYDIFGYLLCTHTNWSGLFTMLGIITPECQNKASACVVGTKPLASTLGEAQNGVSCPVHLSMGPKHPLHIFLMASFGQAKDTNDSIYFSPWLPKWIKRVSQSKSLNTKW